MSDSTPFDAPVRHVPAPVAQVGNVDRAVAHAGAKSAGMDYSPLFEIAQGIDRDPARLIERARWLGSMMGPAAYYSFPMGGKPVEGATISLAEALAGEWGAIAHETHILSAHPTMSGGQRVHIQARAIDLKRVIIGQADAVVSTAPPPAKFARDLEQTERWHAMQMQSAGSKVKRNALLDVLPRWLVDIAVEAAQANASAELLGGKTMQEKFAEGVEWLGRKGITVPDLVAWLGTPSELWAMPQLREVADLVRAIARGETTVAAVKAANAPKPVPRAATAHMPGLDTSRALPDNGEQPDPLAGVRPGAREAVLDIRPEDVKPTQRKPRTPKNPTPEPPPAAPPQPQDGAEDPGQGQDGAEDPGQAQAPRQFVSEYIRRLKDTVTTWTDLAAECARVTGARPADHETAPAIRARMAAHLVNEGQLDPDPEE